MFGLGLVAQVIIHFYYLMVEGLTFKDKTILDRGIRMKYFTDRAMFEKEMQKFKEILDLQGYVLESDHGYADAMQYNKAFEDVKEWLEEQGYKGNIKSAGHYAGVAVYGLYDSKRITLSEMQEKLLDEARSQL